MKKLSCPYLHVSYWTFSSVLFHHIYVYFSNVPPVIDNTQWVDPSNLTPASSIVLSIKKIVGTDFEKFDKICFRYTDRHTGRQTENRDLIEPFLRGSKYCTPGASKSYSYYDFMQYQNIFSYYDTSTIV